MKKPKTGSKATYAPLFTRSAYSFLEGASLPEELVEQAAVLGLPGLALTDRNGVYGVVRAHGRAKELGLRLVVGAEVAIDDGSSLLLLAADRSGYGNLCRLLTQGHRRERKGTCRVRWEEVCARAEGLLALWGGETGLLAAEADGARSRAVGDRLFEAFGDRLYGLVTRHHEAEDPAREARVRARLRRWSRPPVAAVEVLYHDPDRRPLQDVLTCARHGVTLDEAGRRLRPNQAHALLCARAFARRFADDPDAVRRTLEVWGRAAFSLSELRYRYPTERLPNGWTSAACLRQLTFDGARGRYPRGVPARVRAQLERELALICELEYPGYFLTMWEVVGECARCQILCQGRGSAANSAVCYCLGITAVDPAESDLLFERFLSRERAEPPDIDLDIAHERREEVIQYVYQRYGRERAAMVCSVIRYRRRSAVREVGKALGVPAVALGRLARLVPETSSGGGGDGWPAALRAVGLDPEAPVHARLVELTEALYGLPRHLSVHPGGFLLGHEPICELVPIENAAMEGRTVIQWDKDDIDALGLFKIDLLGLGALTVIDRSFQLLRRHQSLDLSLATIPREDPETFAMVQRADTVGVFQIESRAQMAMLPRLQPKTWYDLVIEVSIVRPGPIAGDMVHPYLRRRRGEEPVTYPHPCLEPVLRKTLGVPLFQEQVMRLAMVAADYTPGEADQLRRDMAAWRKRGRIDQHRERLVERMVAKGILREFAERVFEQIRGFGEYGFPESHAASFAHLVYATAWLKCHHPAAFACALLNSQPMGFYGPQTILRDAREHGIEIRPPCVVRGSFEATLEPAGGSSDANHERRPGVRSKPPPPGVTPARTYGCLAHTQSPRCGSPQDAQESGRSRRRTASRSPGRMGVWPTRHPWAIRLGLQGIKGLGEAEGRRVEAAGQRRPFRDLADLARRARPSRRGLEALAEAGALSRLGLSRREALWEARRLWRARDDALGVMAAEPLPRFSPLAIQEEIAWDVRTTGRSAKGHLLAPLRPLLRERGLLSARALNRQPHGARVRYGGLVICRQRPGNAGGVCFVTLEDETGFVNLIVWRRVFERYAVVLKTAPLLAVAGQIEREGEVVHLVPKSLWRLSLPTRLPAVPSYDFH